MNYSAKDGTVTAFIATIPRGTAGRKRLLLVVAVVIAVVMLCVVVVVAVEASSWTRGNVASMKGAPPPHGPNETETGTTVGKKQTTSMPSTPITTKTTNINGSGMWTVWGEWTVCGAACGYGYHSRYRVCETLDYSFYSYNCEGDYVHVDLCQIQPCKVYGNFTTWSVWSNCDLTCGGGTQIRSRTCILQYEDTHCVGDKEQTRDCNTHNCPDCDRVCLEGSLSIDCSKCVCTTTINGYVYGKNGFPVSYVTVAETINPNDVLAISDSFGAFRLYSTCLGINLILRRTMFLDRFVNATNLTTYITMELNEQPFFVVEPISSYRFTRESVTLCCLASGSPNSFYYEWFKDGALMDSSLYLNGTEVHLANLSFIDNGEYRCRVNSDVGSLFSKPASIVVRDYEADFCADAYKQNKQALPEDCVQPLTGKAEFEVGKCEPKNCRFRNTNQSNVNSCSYSKRSCCGVAEYDIVTINCTGYSLHVFIVKGCTCKSCNTPDILIEGQVLGITSGTASKYGDVLLNGKLVDRTNRFGEFGFSMPYGIHRASITFRDNYNISLLETNKVLFLPEEFTGIYRITVQMYGNECFLHFSTSTGSMIYIGQNPSDKTTSVASVFLPANNFHNTNGIEYKGNASICITFLDSSNPISLDNLPGVLQAINEEGVTQELDSLGIFSLSFRDQNGNRITSRTLLNVTLNTEKWRDIQSLRNFTVWGLYDKLGTWRKLPHDFDAGKFPAIGQIDESFGFPWFTIARVRNSESLTHCFFKARLFEDVTFRQEIESLPDYISYRQSVTENNILYQSYGFSNSPSTQCFKAICNDGYGSIQISHYDSITREFIYLPPVNQIKHIGNIGMSRSALEAINYTVSREGDRLQVIFTVTPDGPFYKSLKICEETRTSQNHFRFYYKNKNQAIYTFYTKFDLTETEVNANPQKAQAVSQRVWYPFQAGSSYRVCYVRVSLTSTGLEHSNNSITVVVRSVGGTHEAIKGEILGIREGLIKPGWSTCIEYKCSGEIDTIFKGGYDYTKLSIIPFVGNKQSCKVSQDNLQYEHYGLQPNSNNTGNSVFEAYTPDYYKSSSGVFSSSTDSHRLENARKRAFNDCMSATRSAVTFHCDP